MAFPVRACAFAKRMAAKHPIVLAPMFGNSTPELIAGAANAGAIAFEGGGQLPKDELRSRIRASQALLNEDSVFGVNLFVPSGFYVDPTAWTWEQSMAVELAAKRHDGYMQELTGKVAPAASQPSWEEHEDVFAGQVDAIIEGGVRLVSFHFGWPTAATVARLRDAGATLVGNATTVAEARRLADLGADAIIAQGGEAGGYRGTFLDVQSYRREALIGVLPLVRSVVEAVEVPVIAAGGIMEGADIAAALDAGASAAQLGTAFLSCPECNTSDVHREALLNFGGSGRTANDPLLTVVTQGFTGKPAQGLMTYRAMRMADLEASLPNCFNSMPTGRTVNAAALKAGRADAAYLWAGTGYPRSRALPAAALVETLAAEAAAARAPRL
mmetsp:Transcript_79304/g.224299  ORF Transcript_79304/g.224299 Transcript_79304/m.224299 type:complete len:385 (-) Transcript_79304:240-1394(-)